LVWAVIGAPGPVHGPASATLVAASDEVANNAEVSTDTNGRDPASPSRMSSSLRELDHRDRSVKHALDCRPRLCGNADFPLETPWVSLISPRPRCPIGWQRLTGLKFRFGDRLIGLDRCE
jgi:hypothetical protein